MFGVRAFPLIASGAVAPTLTSVSTSGGAVGDIDGGYSATLTGTGFTGATSVTFGGVAATSVVVVSSTSITCVVPARPSGASSVIVTTPGGSNAANSAFEYFSPAQLSLSEWHRAPYSAAPWAANGSAGASTGRTATSTGFDPTAGTAVNGRAPALFARASSQALNASVANNTLFSTAAGTFICLAKTTTQQAVSGTAYGDGNLLSDPTNAETTAGLTSSGFVACIYDGAYKRPTAIALANNTWGACEMVYDSSTLSTRVNGGTAQSVACGAYTPVTTSAPKIGYGYNIGYLDGSILEWMTSTTAISLANRDKIRAYLNTRYFPSGAQV